MNSERELTGDWSNPVEVVLTDVTWEQATKTHYDIIQQKTLVSSEYLHRVHLVLPTSLRPYIRDIIHLYMDKQSSRLLRSFAVNCSWFDLIFLTRHLSLVSTSHLWSPASSVHCPLNESSAIPFIAKFSQGSALGSRALTSSGSFSPAGPVSPLGG